MKKYIATLIISSLILANPAFADSNSTNAIKYDDNLQITLKSKIYTGKFVNDSLIRSLNKSLIGKNDSDKINGIKGIIQKIDGVIIKLSAINNTNRNNLISVLQNIKNYYSKQSNDLTQSILSKQQGQYTSESSGLDSRGSYQSGGIGGAGAFDAAKAQSDFNGMTKEEQKVYKYNKYGVYDGITRQEAINNIRIQGDYKDPKTANSVLDKLVKDYGLIVK